MKADWVAVRGANWGAVLDGLGLVETGEQVFREEPRIYGAELPGGWVVVCAQDYERFERAQWRALSAGGELVACRFYEVVMTSEAHGWRDGQEAWSVLYDPEEAERLSAPFQTTGELPESFADIAARLQDAQEADGEDVDHLFDAPIELAHALSGFRPDKRVAAPEVVFRTLVSPKAAGRDGGEAARARNIALRRAVEAEIHPLVAQRGFEPVTQRPEHNHYERGATHAFVRERGEWAESLEVCWGWQDGRPLVWFLFFVRRGVAPRYGSGGQALPQVRRGLAARVAALLSRPPGQDELIAKAIAEARDLLQATDAYLSTGQAHPDLILPKYLDEAAAA